MKKLLITKLAEILNARFLTDCGQNLSFSSVNTDSRTVKPGECFFAIAGENFDGHNFLPDVFAKGASCAVVSKDVSLSDYPILKVDDTIKALGRLAAWYRNDCNFKVVAITGSAGKTTTRQIVHHVLSKKFKTHQPAKNFNNFIGLPLTILAAPPDSQILILELATNHPGEIEYLSRIASPDIALVTNAYPAHLAGFGSIENIAKEKLSIAKGISPKGILIINADCPTLLDSANKQNLSFETFTLSKIDVTIAPLSGKFKIDNLTVEIPLPGRGNIENALAAWSICSKLGVSARYFADALKSITPVSMRSELLNIGTLTVISDCYNANPASMKNALDILTNLAANKNCRSVFICGDMAELGESEKSLHQQFGQQIATSGVHLLITVGPLAALAADTAKIANPNLQTARFTQTAQLCDNLHKFIKDSDIILIKGSRINKLEIVIEKLKKLKNIT